MRSIHIYNDDGTLHEFILHTDSDAELLVMVYQTIGWARNGIWSAYGMRPQFMKWDRDGVMQSSFVAEVGLVHGGEAREHG